MAAAAASRPILMATSSLGIGISGWIFYDYKTCHPMREMQGYDVGGAWIRFHNTFRPKFTIPTMSLEDLSHYDGGSGDSIYFASEGWVWDVSASQTFQEAYGLWKGKDASIALAKMSMSKTDAVRTDWATLNDAEWKSLQSWTDYFQQKYVIVGQIQKFPHRRK